MKLTKTRSVAAILLCIVIGLSCIGCSTGTKTQTNQKPSTNQTQNQSTSQNSDNKNNSQETVTDEQTNKTEGTQSQAPSNDLTVDAYNEKINYYMELVESLQSEIVDLKEAHYIKESEYKAKITSLESTVAQLLDRIESVVSGGTITPIDPSDSLSSGSSDGIDNISKKNEFEYTVENGKATITKYIGNEVDVEIPNLIDGYSVCAIGESAFQNCDVQNVTVPDSVRLIDWFAFAGCTSLQSISIPSSVIRVEYGAFDYCPRSMKILCEKESYIEAYALSWGMSVIAK